MQLHVQVKFTMVTYHCKVGNRYQVLSLRFHYAKSETEL